MESLTDEDIALLPISLKKKVTEIITLQGNEVLVQKVLLQNKEKELETLRVVTENQLSQLKRSLDDKANLVIAFEEDKNDLSAQLTSVKEENSKLQDNVSKNESKLLEFEKNNVKLTNERDHFSFMVDRRNEQIERLQKDLQEMEKISMTPKADGKSSATSFKETLLEQEKEFLCNQQISLKRDLERNTQELLSVKRECSLKIMTIENKLYAKSEDLRLAKATINQLEKINESLVLKAEDLVIKNKSDSEEMRKMVEYYERELQSQKKLVQLHKDSSDENSKQIDKLTTTISELQSMLYDNTNEHSETENRFKLKETELNSELQEKENMISKLQEEITILTDLIKSGEYSSTTSFTKIGSESLNITEVYCAYVKATEQNLIEKRENDKLKLQLKNILCEIEDRAPVLKQQTLEYQTLVEANMRLNTQLEALMGEKSVVNGNLEAILAKFSFLERENAKLTRERGDLSRQVCHLLKEIEILRGDAVSDDGFAVSLDANADEVITKRLVTFSSIKELQENNTKLLLLVRDLSTKLEEIEEAQQISDTSKFEDKMTSYLKKIEDLQDSQEKQTQMIKSCIDQRDRYKDLYLESIKSPNTTSEDISQQNIASASTSDLMQKLRHLEEVSREFEEYRQETQNNSKLANEEKDNLRSELRDLTAKNFKLASTVEFKIEQMRLVEKTTEMHKKQIETLETRNRNYEAIISKHELNLRSLSDELFKLQNQHASDEVVNQHLKKENEYLKSSESRLLSEKQLLDRESHNQQVLLQNLEHIRTNLQKSETEGRIRLERNLEEATRECFALRRHLQEETASYKVKLSELENNLSMEKQEIMAKKEEIKQLKAELLVLKDTLTEKIKENEQISLQSQRIGSSKTPDKVESQKEFERKMEEYMIEIESLKRELSLTRDHCKQYCHMAEQLEKELKSTNALHKEELDKMNSFIDTLQKENIEKQEKLTEIEEQLLLQLSKPTHSASKNDFAKLQDEMKDMIEKHKEVNKELRYLREHCSTLTSEVQKAEQKYANEMILHSADVQTLATLKEDYQKLLDEMNLLKTTKANSNELLLKKQESWNELECQFKKEQDNLKLQVSNLHKHNELLHNQIQELSNNVSLLSSKDRHQDDELFETKSSEELLQIINYLRKEKALISSKCELIENENSRIKLELELLKKNYNDVNEKLQSERVETEIFVSSSNKHDELLRKLEMINAITDSNRVLRDERDSISKRLAQATETLQTLESNLAPLQEKNQESQSKIIALSNENSSLRIEVTRWRQRANTLVERSNKISVDDFKKLTTEKENLAKIMLTEKDNVKRLSEEVNLLKSEKLKLEVDLTNLKKSNQVAEEEYSKELSRMQDILQKSKNELKDISLALEQKEAEISKLNEENTLKETQLNDLRNKELQVRKIAKRYKDSYMELKKQVDEKNIELSLSSQQSEAVDSDENLNNLLEENNSLKREIEVLKVNLEKEERNRNLLREAKQRIIALQTVNKELQSKKIENLHDTVTDPASFSNNDELLTTKVAQINRQIALQSVKPMPASTSTDKGIESLRTANVKPITPSTTQNTASITSWRGSETPLASIRPMTVQSGRSIAIIPSTATTTDSTISTNTFDVGCVNVNNSGQNTVVVATVPPLGSIEDTPGDAESLQCSVEESNSSSSSMNTVHHTVALISPRIEQAHSNEAIVAQASTVESEVKTTIGTTSLQPASSSIQPTTTTHIHPKRPREMDASTASDDNPDNSQQIKKSRMIEGGEVKASVSKFTNEIEYQVPTSSQHDHEEDIIEIEEEREVSTQFHSNITCIESGSSSKDVQMKEHVTSAQNNGEECEGGATSTNANNANASSSNTWYQEDKGLNTNNLPLHTTMNEENSSQSREEDIQEFQQGSSNDLDQLEVNETLQDMDTSTIKTD